jgi:HAMP domain-containing protein
MPSTSLHVRLVSGTLIVGFGLISVPASIAQPRLTSLEELRRELATGDFITVVPADGQPVAGRLMRLGNVDLDIRLAGTPRRVTIALDAIQSLERPRDSARNGAAIGASIGAGFGGALFVHAIVIDRNEIEEWAPVYAGVAAVCTGIGALIGWAMDAARSKPPIRFDVPSEGRPKLSAQPVYSRGRGIAITVSFSR